jgi:Zn-dependent alcohol dehydrogenase
VRVVATRICHTDAIGRDGVYPVPLPAVLGHEGGRCRGGGGKGGPSLVKHHTLADIHKGFEDSKNGSVIKPIVKLSA